MASGLWVLHQLGYRHKDVKLSNILLGEDWSTAKLADYGFVKLQATGDSQTSQFQVGTPHYLDPQVHDYDVRIMEHDVYSLGVVLLQLLTGTACPKTAKSKAR